MPESGTFDGQRPAGLLIYHADFPREARVRLFAQARRTIGRFAIYACNDVNFHAGDANARG